jgi:phage tail P2-like protein
MNKTLLPPNATAQERAIEGAISRVGEVSVPLRDLWNPKTCPVDLLPWLAWALSVDEWESDWPEQIKRDVIAGSMEIHRHKGTPWAVEQALILAGMPFARVEEWFEYAGTPGHFKVVVDIEGQSVSAAEEAKLLRYVESAKRKSAKLDSLDYNLSVLTTIPAHAVGLQSSEIITVYPQ